MASATFVLTRIPEAPFQSSSRADQSFFQSIFILSLVKSDLTVIPEYCMILTNVIVCFVFCFLFSYIESPYILIVLRNAV